MKCQIIKKINNTKLLKSPEGKYYIENMAEEVLPVSKKDVLKFLRGEL